MNIDLGPRELSVVKFALWRLMSNAYDRAIAAAQAKENDYFLGFSEDAKNAEQLLERLDKL